MKTTKPIAVFDTEIYKNYFLFMIKEIESGRVRYVELRSGDDLLKDIGADRTKVRNLLREYVLVGFNSTNFDLPIVTAYLAGFTTEEIKAVCDTIILHGAKPHHIYQKFNLKPLPPGIKHIDVMGVAPGKASLKLYGGRMHTKKLQDLPIEPDAILTEDEIKVTRTYCANDLNVTAELYNSLKPQLQLREQMSDAYGVDLMSKSDAQIAERVISKLIQDHCGYRLTPSKFNPNVVVKYSPAEFIHFDSPQLKAAKQIFEEADFYLNESGKLITPPSMKGMKVTVGDTAYALGIGGIHSTESVVSHHSDDKHILQDFDVASYYPAIILNCRLMLNNLGGEEFLKVFKSIVDKRLDAKAKHDTVTANSLKIVVNSTYGHFSNRWSSFYAPNMTINVTLTGQLALLMLIEKLEANGAKVVSANTDGIVVRSERNRTLETKKIVVDWEKETGFSTEEAMYASLYSRDINNYIAIKPDGKIKSKGVFTPAGLQKNPANEVCVDAVVEYLRKGRPLRKHIEDCKDIKKFLSVRTVTGGAVFGNRYLGKVVRWYYKKGNEGAIRYKVNGNLVPKTEGAEPVMDLPEVLDNIDYDRYVRESEEMLLSVGGDLI